jgi:hypothetical protein
MSECLMIPAQISCKMTHLLVFFSSLLLKCSFFCCNVFYSHCTSAFASPLSLLFNRSSATCVFLDRWKLSYVTAKFKKGRCNNVDDYSEVTILSAISKLFELLVYRIQRFEDFDICKPIDGD